MLKKLRIVIGSLEVGGAERHLSYILPKLADKGWEIRLIVLSRHLSLLPMFEHQNITAEVAPQFLEHLINWPSPLKRLIAISIKIARLIKEYFRHPGYITHFFLPESYLLGTLATYFVHPKAPLVMSRRSLNNYQTRRPILGKLEKKIHPRVHQFLGNSKAVCEQLIGLEGIDEHKCQLIYNGIPTPKDFSHQHPALKKSLGLPEDAIILVLLANLIPYKGHQDLITALALIAQQQAIDIHLICIGQDNGIQSTLNRQAQDNGIGQNIHFVGTIKDPTAYLQLGDIGLLVSHEEGFSNAVLECMAVGLPMIVTDVGGNAEAVSHNVNGLVVPPKEPLALADAIVSLCENKTMRIEMGKASQKRFNELFQLERCVQQYEDFYQTRCLEKYRTK